MFEKLKYWSWKNWYLASFPFGSPTRFIAEMRIFGVYDVAFRRGGLKEVKKEHKKHLEHLAKMIKI